MTISEGANSLTLNWKGDKNVTYNVYRNNELIATGLTESTYTDKNVEEGQTYVYEVTALKNDKESSRSESTTITTQTNTVEVDSIQLDNQSIQLEKSKTKQLAATVLPPNATDKTVEWTSSDATIATVVNGLVTAKKNRECNDYRKRKW